MLYREWRESDLADLTEWFQCDVTRRRFGGMLPLNELYARTRELQNQGTLLFFSEGQTVGLSTVEFEGDNKAVISLLVNPCHRRQSYGRKILSEILKILDGKKIYAYIESENKESIKLFGDCGFVMTDKDKDGFLEFSF
jgi:ribosomal protein S18 acetylase RimI-like enzyme